MNWIYALLVFAAVVILVLAFQIWRKGGIDTAKAGAVVDEDVAAAKSAGSRFVAWVKKLFHKEPK
jgi:hypothetical protein